MQLEDSDIQSSLNIRGDWFKNPSGYQNLQSSSSLYKRVLCSPSSLWNPSMDPTHQIGNCLNPRMWNLWIQRASNIQKCTKCGWRHSNGEDGVLPSGTRILVVTYLIKRKKSKTILASVKCYEGNETGPYGRETEGGGGKGPSGDAVCAKP